MCRRNSHCLFGAVLLLLMAEVATAEHEYSDWNLRGGWTGHDDGYLGAEYRLLFATVGLEFQAGNHSATNMQAGVLLPCWIVLCAAQLNLGSGGPGLRARGSQPLGRKGLLLEAGYNQSLSQPDESYWFAGLTWRQAEKLLPNR